jgi:hypothetical protein
VEDSSRVDDVAILELKDREALRDVPKNDPSLRRFVIAVSVGWAVVTLPYLWFLTDLWTASPSFLRSFIPNLSDLYDLQARAMLHGHLYTPKGSLGYEAFVHDGKQYTYFGLFPSLLRIPVFLFTHSLDGRLSALSILLAWLLTGTFSILSLWRVRLFVRGPAMLGRAEAASYGILIATIMGGSVLINLAANPWVYSEDIAWGTALTFGALFELMGVLEAPSWNRILAAGGFILAAELTRGSVGLGCVAGAVLVAIWLALGRAGQENRRWSLPALLAGVIPLLAGFAVSYAKFGVISSYPLQDQLFYKHYLSSIKGSYFSLRYVPTTTAAYFGFPGLHISNIFPFITLPLQPAKAVGHVQLYGTDEVPSIPASTPLLFLLTIWGVIAAFRPTVKLRTRLTSVPLLAAAVPCGVILIFGFLDQRFLGDFLPLFALGSFVGLTDLWSRIDARGFPLRLTMLSAVALLGLFGVVANMAMESTPNGWWSFYQAHRFVSFQKQVSDSTGKPLASNVVQTQTLPASASLDELYTTGYCSALYIRPSSGVRTWLTVEKTPGQKNPLCRSIVKLRFGAPYGTGATAGTGTQLARVGAIGGFSRDGYDYNIYDLDGYSEQRAATAIYHNHPVAGLAMTMRYNPIYNSAQIEIPNAPGLPPVNLGAPYGTGATPGSGTQIPGVGAVGGFFKGGYYYNIYDLDGYSQQRAAAAIYDNHPTAGLSIMRQYNSRYDSTEIEIPNAPNQPAFTIPRGAVKQL